jgi:hypothetical protein
MAVEVPESVPAGFAPSFLFGSTGICCDDQDCLSFLVLPSTFILVLAGEKRTKRNYVFPVLEQRKGEMLHWVSIAIEW